MPRLAFPILIVLTAACAARAPRAPLPTVADAERLASAGCYVCLVEALKVYDALMANKPSPAAARGAFRTAVLLAAREKEVGLPATAYLDRARGLASALAPADDGQLALDVVSALPWDYAGVAKEFTEEFIRTRQAAGPQVAGWRERLQPRLADPLFAYLDASLVCTYGDYRSRDAALDAIRAQHDASLLVKYRLGVCSQQRQSLLHEVLASEPRYAEAHLFLGRYGLVDASRGRGRRSEIALHLTTAYEVFPQSPSVTFTMAGLYRAISRLKDALRYYDETLSLVPTHREALLGRVIALTYTQQPDEAAHTSTRLIELGEWYIGDAYYWRAFNRRLQKRLDEALQDAEIAKKVASLRSDVFLLAGIIYYERHELVAAATDLAKSWELSDLTCDAAWYLGLVRAEQKDWAAAGDMFPRAASCYRQTAEVYRAERGAAENAVESAAEKEQVSKEYEPLIADQLVGEARAYYNAAYASAQRGERARAIELAERAAQHAIMKDKAAELIAALKKSPG